MPGFSHHIHPLEARRLFATVGWDIGISGAGTAGISDAQQNQIKDFVQRTGNEWVALIPSEATSLVTLRVNVVIDAAAAGSAGRLAARSLDEVAVTGSSISNLFDQRATAFTRYGRDDSFDGADIELDIDPNYFKNSLWFDPNPDARATSGAAAVPAGKIDAYSAILHEMGHAFFFNGLLNESDYTPIDSTHPSDRSTFDHFVTVTANQPFFTGPSAIAERTENVPLTRLNLYHLGNTDGPGADLVTSGNLMNGQEFNTAQRYFIGDLEKAMVADMVVAGTRTVVVDPPPPPAPVTFTFSGNVAFPYTTAQGQSVTILLKGAKNSAGSGQIIFPEGTSTNAPVGNPTMIQIFNTDSKTSLTISASTPISLPNLTINSSKGLASLIAPNVTLTGTSSIAGIGTLNLGQISAGTLTIGTAIKSTSLAINGIFDSNVSLPGAKTITLGSIQDTDSTPNTLTLGAVPTLIVNGSLNGNLLVNGALGKTTIDNISNAAVTVSGNVTSFTVKNNLATANLTAPKWGNITIGGNLSNTNLSASSTLANITVGGNFTSTNLFGPAGIGAVSVASATASKILAGLSLSSTIPTTLPTPAAPLTFTTPKAAIKSFTTRSGTFSNTLVIAPSIGASSLGTVTVANASKTFGLYAGTLTSLTASTQTSPALKLKKTTKPFTFTDTDFAVTVF